MDQKDTLASDKKKNKKTVEMFGTHNGESGLGESDTHMAY